MKLLRGIEKLRKLCIRAYKDRFATFVPYIKKKEIEGVSFDFYIADWDGRDWYDIHCTDPIWTEMRWLKDNMLVPGDIVVECGGHHGCTAILLSKWVGTEGKVITYEPNPYNAEVIRKNISLNRLENVEVRQKAVGNRCSYVILSNESNAKVLSLSVVDSGKNTAELIKLDDEFIDGISPTLLKIDVEGYECEVLKGASNILRKLPKLAIEIHNRGLSRYGSSVKEFIELLPLDKYQYWFQFDDADEPVLYDAKLPLENFNRAHLFAIPK